jgi:hypothetical protein
VRCGGADAWDRGQQRNGRFEVGHRCLEPPVQPLDRFFESVNALEVLACHERVTITEPPLQRIGESRNLVAQASFGHFGEHARVTLTLDQGTEHRSTRDSGGPGCHR